MEYTVESVETYWPNPGTECWAVTMQRPDSGTHAYVFPKFSLVQRAAEYGLDPGDIDTLLDIVLHEQFIHTGNPADDPAAQQGMVAPALASRKGELVPVDLFNAPTITQARDAHLARVEHAKKTRGRVRPPAKGRDPLDVIRAEHGVTPDGVAARARTVDLERRALRGQLTDDERRALARTMKGAPRA